MFAETNGSVMSWPMRPTVYREVHPSHHHELSRPVIGKRCNWVFSLLGALTTTPSWCWVDSDSQESRIDSMPQFFGRRIYTSSGIDSFLFVRNWFFSNESWLPISNIWELLHHYSIHRLFDFRVRKIDFSDSQWRTRGDISFCHSC